uniref:RING-type domain-containing protein n=1 Tax=Rhabditophanes sp. KR3021 TaxID=114890 RepID=A0AC35U6D0_9BILA
MAVNKECLDKALRISMNEICSDSNIKVENILDSIDDCYSALTTSKSVENFNLVEKMVADEDGNLVLHQFEEWSFSDSLLFCYTVVTTIGYGNVAPKSFGGRLFCIFYGLFGIPFTLLAIADLGKFISEIMATTTKVYGAFWRRMRRRLRKIKFSHPLLNCIIQQAFGKSNNTSAQNSTFRLDKIDDDLEKGYFEEDEKPLTSIPDDTNNNKRKESNQSDSIISCDDKIGIIASEEDNKKDTDKKENEEDDEEEEKGAYTNQACSLMGFFIIYLIVGSVLLSTYEPNMTFFNALYFAFVSLSSIGLGDIVPKSQQYLLFTIIYISIGLALTTIAIDIAADYLKKLHYFGRKIENVASVTIWFGGKKLTMGQLVRNLGDQFNLPIHTIKSLDLDEFVDKAIKVEAGELESLRPPAIQPEMLNTLIDSVGFADGDDEWPGGNEQDNWESPIREKIVTPPRALTPIIFKNSSPLPRSPTPPPKSPTPPPPRIPTPPPPTPPPRTPTPPPKIPSPPPKSPTPPRIPTPEPVKVKTPELTKKEKPRQLTAAELEEQKRKAYSEDAWKRYQEYQKQWKKLRQVKTDYKPGASSSSKRSLQNSPAMSVVAEEAQKQMHKQKSLQNTYVNELYASSQAAAEQEQLEKELREQKRRARITGLLEQIPIEKYDILKMPNCDECTICMFEFESNMNVRVLPCKHTYHVECIDDWLLRNFSCPMCMTPVDSSMLSTFASNFTGSDLASISCNAATIGTSLR